MLPHPPCGRAPMSDRMLANSALAFSPPIATSPSSARPVAARTKSMLEGPVLPTLLRLAAPNILNLLAIAGMITFDGLFVGRLGPDATPWSGRCRLGPDDTIWRWQSRAARLPALVPLARHFGVPRRGSAVGTFRRNPQGRRAGIDQCDHQQPVRRAVNRDRRPPRERRGHRLRDGRAPRIHPYPAGIRFRHCDRRDGRHQLGRQTASPCLPNRVDGRGNRRGCVRVNWIDRRPFSSFVDGSFYRRWRDRPRWRSISPNCRTDLRLLRSWDGALFRNPRVRKRHLDRDRERHPPAHKHRMRTCCRLLARSWRDRIVYRNRRRFLRIRGTDICRDIEGEAGLSPATGVTVTDQLQGGHP